MRPDSRNRVKTPSAFEIVRHFASWDLDPRRRAYLRFHARRYAYLLEKVARIVAARILDIGISFETVLLREIFPEAEVHTLGFDDPRIPRRPQDRHLSYDLNAAPDRSTWFAVEPYDLVVMAEVIEHLHTAARPVLRYVREFVRPGGTLLLQTPNAVRLGRRWSTVRGISPFDLVREDRANPGHYCEFTLSELCGAVEAAGLIVTEVELANYFREASPAEVAYDALCRLLPGRLHDGITLVARRPSLP